MKTMATDKFYVINGNVVTNIIVCDEDYAAQNNLLRYPVVTQYGLADIDWTYIDNTFLPPPRDILNEWAAVRARRNTLLGESDFIVMLPDRWAALPREEQQAWIDYRQDLRDIPAKFIDPRDVVFPTSPASK